jgi:formylglycine-generating enzyme required for sulfatase activity
VTSTPVDGARVEVDGEEVGATPLVDAEIRPGRHRLSVRAPRHLEYRDSLEIEGGGVKQSLEVALVPAWAPVTIQTDPPGAAIFVDGEPLGTAPGTFEVGQGTRTLEAKLPGHKPHRSLLVVEADVPQTLPEIQLQPADGRLSVETDPPGAQLSVGDRYPGHTPLTVDLAPGRRHELTLIEPGYEVATREVELAPDEERTLRVKLQAQIGTVEVSARPAGALVEVDGRPVGAAPQRLELLAVPHQLRITKPGYAEREVAVTPRKGQTQRVDIELMTVEEHRRVATPASITTARGQELVRVDPGALKMGTPRGSPDRRANETPRPVELTRPFFFGVREISNREFRAFRPDHHSPSHRGGSLDGDDQPVVGVSWEDAARFCNWLSQQEGLAPAYVERGGVLEAASPMTTGYRLPSEAEWAWAARFTGGHGERTYGWGDKLPPRARSGNYADVSASGILPDTMRNYEDGFAVSAPVGSGPPNPLGIRDLGGNVAEWVHDIYTIYPPRRGETAVRDPLGPKYGRSHVIRGASWKDARPARLRLAYRDYSEGARDDVGFRIARSVN